MYNILLIGDSLTDLGYHSHNGWGYYMKLRYNNKANIINKGICNYSSQMIKDLFYNLLDNSIIHLYTILLGTNDCYNNNVYVSPNQYKENILFMIDTIRNTNPNCFILLITPPICSYHNGIYEYVDRIYQIIKERQDITLIDLHNGPNNIELIDLDKDGLHFNKKGNWKIYTKVKDAVEKHLYFSKLK
jgi:lysophospholipase L1-like esterase